MVIIKPLIPAEVFKKINTNMKSKQLIWYDLIIEKVLKQLFKKGIVKFGRLLILLSCCQNRGKVQFDDIAFINIIQTTGKLILIKIS